MKLSQYSITELLPYILGEESQNNYRKGSDLVKLFNRVGLRDLYDFKAGGLPKLNSESTFNTSRKDYVKDRLDKLNGTEKLRTLIDLVINEADNTQSIATSIGEIISNDGYNVTFEDDCFHVIGGVVHNEQAIINEVRFKEYEAQLLKELDSAKVYIIVAVAWISNERLVSKLIEKFNAGVDVKVIINNDGTNKKYCPDFRNIPIYSKRGDKGGIMHHKFCVIDNQVVIHGSYNWSNNAEFKNDETMEITKGNNEMATEFSVEFRSLLNNSKPFNKIQREL